MMERSGGGGKARKAINKAVGVIIVAIITAEVLSACGVKPEEKEARAKAVLEQKYGIKFEIAEIYPQKFGELYYEVQAYPADDPLTRFSASIDTEDDGCSDTFVERRVCRDIAEQVAQNLDSLEGYYDLFVISRTPPAITADKDISIYDYSQLDKPNLFRVNLYVKPEGADAGALYQSLSGLLTGLEYLDCETRLYLVDQEQMEAVQAYLETHDVLDSDYQQMTNKN